MYGGNGAERREGGSGVGGVLEIAGGSSVFLGGVCSLEHIRDVPDSGVRGGPVM